MCFFRQAQLSNLLLVNVTSEIKDLKNFERFLLQMNMKKEQLQFQD